MRCLLLRLSARSITSVLQEAAFPVELGHITRVMLGLTLGLAMPLPTHAQTETCTALPQPQRLNTEQIGEIIHIGAIPWRPYRVIVPVPEADILTALRACVPDAYQSQSRLGPFIQVGSFATRAEAEVVHRQFTDAGYSTRVIHQRGVAAF